MNKSKRAIPESIGLFIPAQKFRKRLSIVFLALISTWVFPPHAIAYEVAQAQQKAQVEQHARDQRTKASPHLKIAQQTEATTQLLIKTCRQIESNLAEGKSIDVEMKDIEAFKKNFDEIKERSLKQMDAQRAQMVEKKASEKILERVDTTQKNIRERFTELSSHLNAVTDNKSKPEQLKTAVQNLAAYLEKHANQPTIPPRSTAPGGKEKAYLPRRSAPAEHTASIYSSLIHNPIRIAAANDVIGGWLTGLDGQATSGPANENDLKATPEIIIDDEIRDLAASLENHPLKIFEYVRNDFAYEPYWGSQKGAKRTLLEKAGNDVDLASLTMALLRASGIHCRYIMGTIEMTIEEAGKWIGVEDPVQIAKTFQANGIPFETITSGGKIAKIKLNHTWINAYVDYFPYHGGRNEKPNTWIGIDPSFKQNTFTTKTDLQTTIGINPDTLLVNVKAQSEQGPENSYSAKVPESFILSEIFSYQEPIRSYLAANSLTTENVFRQRKVNEERYGLFPVTDNYKIAARGLSFNALPDSISAKVTFTLRNTDNSEVFTYTTALANIADARITLGYTPATDSDRNIITNYAAADNFPVYLVNLIPQLKINDTVVGSGSAIGMGGKQQLDVVFSVPGFDPSLSQTPVTVGSFSALVPDYQTVTAAEISRQHAKLVSLPANLASSRDVVLGESLRAIGLSYWHQLDRFNQVTAGNLGVAITRVPSMIKVSWDLNITEQLRLPFTASVNRIRLDIIRDYNVPVAINQDKLAGENQFAFTSALTGTALEHNVLAQPFAGEAASAARVIQQANNSNMKVYTITATNANTLIPLLNLPATVINDIRNAVNANLEVTVPEAGVMLHGIEYFAYVKRDIDTSASEFFLDSRGGETLNNALKAADLLTDGSAEAYANVSKPLADWLNIAVDSTTNAGLAYLPAITALNSWYAKRTTLDPVTTIAAIIAVSGPITKVFNQPAILNVVTGDKLISPNGDTIKDSFTLSAVVTRNANWKFQILNAQNQAVITEENNTPNINIDFNQKIPDGTYTYRVTAIANGVNADPISGTFRVDCTPPTVAFTSPDAATAITQNKSILLKGTADDINFEKVTITAKAVDAAEPVVIHESNDITVENLLATIVSAKYTNGPLLITMTAWDKAGNKNFVTRTFNLDNPVPDLQVPTVNMIAKNGAADIVAGSTVDAESGKLDIEVTAADNIRVAKINLLLDGAIAATVADKTELAHALNTMTLRDGAHTLQAEAYDAAGNSAKSALLNFTLTSPISNFKVTPTLAKPGTSQINVTANLREATNWTLTFVGKTGTTTQIPPVSGTTAAVAHSFNPASYGEGEYTVTLTVNDKTPELPFIINMVLNRPIATIANLNKSADEAIPVVREGLFNLIGTADDVDVADTVSYKVAVYNHEGELISDVTPKPVNAQGFHEGRVSNASLGELDFTMLRNNAYTLQLTVTDGQFTSTAEADFALNSELKIGQMSFSQQDLVIPVNGHPISVIRTYNSLNSKVKGDFGYGWTYSIKDIEVEFNENRYNTRDESGEIFSCRSGGSRDVTITMPDGKRVTFVHSIQSSGWPFPTYKNYWTAPAGVYASLVPTCSNEIVSLPGGMTYWTASGPGTEMDQFDVPGFILTLKDGTKYEIARIDGYEHFFDFDDDMTSMIPFVHTYGKAFVRSITDTNGNRTVFSDHEIAAYNATGERTKSIYFERNNNGLITAIYAPSSQKEDGTPAENAPANYKYEYDTQQNLTKVHKLIDRTKPINEQYVSIEYLYAEPTRPHFVTSIKDPLGNIPVRCEYDESGRLIATIDANGNHIELNHDLVGRTETVIDSMGNPTIQSYDAHGNIIGHTDALGNTTKFSYDYLGNQTSITDPLGNITYRTYDNRGNQTSETDPLGNITYYEFDNKGNQTKMIDAIGNVTIITYNSAGNPLTTTNSLGNTTSLNYDKNGKMEAIFDENGKLLYSYAHDSNGNMTSSTDRNGIARHNSYNNNGQLTGKRFVWTNGEQSREVIIKTVYDDSGRAIKRIDSNGNETSIVYNMRGKVSQVTDMLGNTKKITYDIQGNEVKIINPNGTIIQTVYDSNGRVYIQQNAHLPGQATDGTRVVYNSAGRMIRVEKLSNVRISTTDSGSYFDGFDNILSSTGFIYDAAGRIVRITDAKGNVTIKEYDAANHTIAIVDPLDNRTEYNYDALGRQISIKDALGRIIRYEYNALGKKTKTILPDGSYTLTKYNNLGHRIEDVDFNGLSTKYEYNDIGNIIAVVKPEVDDPESGGKKAPRWEYTYNQYGNRTAIKDPKGRITTFKYDEHNRQISRTLPMGQTDTIEYNTFGQLVMKTDFKGQRVQSFYDNLGHTTRLCYYTTGGTAPEEEVSYSYDELGRVSTINEPQQGETRFIYNDHGQIQTKQAPERSIHYAYDVQTQARIKTTTDQSEIRYTYDELGRLKTTEVYKRNGIVLNSPEIITHKYNKVGGRESVILPNGISASYEYNNLNQLSKLTYTKNESLLASYAYEALPSNHRAKLVEDNAEILYSYDNMYRLIREVRTGDQMYDLQYIYDLNGNRLQKKDLINNETINYEFNDNDQLINEVSNAIGTTVYQYDANGSLTSKHNGGRFDDQYTYDLRNRLSGAEISRKEGLQDIAISSNYVYNTDGLRTRVEETVNNVTRTRQFLLDNGHTGFDQVFEEYTAGPNETLTRSYVIGDDVFSQNINGVTSHLIYDGHGSTRMLTDTTGTVTERYAFDAYGKMLGGNPNVTDKQSGTDFLYAGEQFDPGLQMQYLRARYYNQDIGGLNRLDPFLGNINNPQSLHKYTYVHNDPVNGIDPSGYVKETSGVLGQIVHLIIQVDYLTTHGGDVDIIAFARNNDDELIDLLRTLRSAEGIFGVSADAIFKDAGDKIFRPDIMNHTTGEVFEIKPTAQEESGRAQLALYVTKLNSTQPRIGMTAWHEGLAWNGTTVHYMGQFIATVEFKSPGMLIYELNENPGNQVPEKFFVRNFKKVRDALKDHATGLSAEAEYAFQQVDWQYNHLPAITTLALAAIAFTKLRMETGFLY